MKKRHAEWLKLTANTTSHPAPHPVLIRIFDLPGFETIERKLLLYTSARSELSPSLEFEVNDLSERTFGIIRNDTLFLLPIHYNSLHAASSERWKIEDEFNEHEDQYETSDATDDEAVTILASLGLDFNDSRGQPLRCTRYFCRQAEAAAKGLMGRMPDQAAANLEVWGSALEQAARVHMNKKRQA
ncbi:hypothetical protein [Mesorhizobium sp.]|uniref:hypothetical protein n=1 Tax=Mesorhizobium sp. TaxID=1871066 RepID=UPI000FE8DBF7|nr:hypothetical protein [Mesorhizobium sp.]RWP25150.1 MAG: hypothetical protein EOR02_29970 [Mesorhizobium sp.]